MKVRLTVQIRDAQNHIRMTAHRDVQLKESATKAGEIAGGLAKFITKERKTLTVTDDEQD